MFGPLLMALMLFIATPTAAGDVHAATLEDFRSPDLNGSFDHTTPRDVLRGLFTQALATLQEYIEVETTLPAEGPSQPQTGEFRLKLFPQGKSHSQDHLTAEGIYRRSPDAGQEFTLRFKSSRNPPSTLPPLSDDVL
ncbi:MAG: hypothetical protein OJF47_001038 [Nitrospira sp.]|jgi:hypothetical protein|nr:MAG: hypothetical protein OJF47_001038 [Nitrospira sp.]